MLYSAIRKPYELILKNAGISGLEKSKEGFGTTFYLKLPVDNESHLA